MSLFDFIFAFIGLLVAGPIVIIGWYAITRGRIEYTADGIPFRTGKIFKGWHFFWTKTKGSDKVYLAGGALRQAAIKIQKEFKVGLRVSGLFITPSSETVFDHLMERKDQIEEMVKAEMEPDGGGSLIFMRNVPKYAFSEMLRDPMSECPTCMASVYGTVIWWTVQVLSAGQMFAWYNGSWIWAAIPFWVTYCIGCAYVNTLLAKKL